MTRFIELNKLWSTIVDVISTDEFFVVCWLLFYCKYDLDFNT